MTSSPLARWVQSRAPVDTIAWSRAARRLARQLDDEARTRFDLARRWRRGARAVRRHWEVTP